MVATESSAGRKREYVIVRYGTQFYYARANREDDDRYDIMTPVDYNEGKMIIDKANQTSNYQEFLSARETNKQS